MTSVLVLSGSTSRADLATSAVQPDFIIENLAGLVPGETPAEDPP
jgi:ribonucleotide monophosphatase NagD (HAD superfamily)